MKYKYYLIHWPCCAKIKVSNISSADKVTSILYLSDTCMQVAGARTARQQTPTLTPRVHLRVFTWEEDCYACYIMGSAEAASGGHLGTTTVLSCSTQNYVVLIMMMTFVHDNMLNDSSLFAHGLWSLRI